LTGGGGGALRGGLICESAAKAIDVLQCAYQVTQAGEYHERRSLYSLVQRGMSLSGGGLFPTRSEMGMRSTTDSSSGVAEPFGVRVSLPAAGARLAVDVHLAADEIDIHVSTGQQ